MAIRKRLKAGFTLVELMIVVAIVGVLAVLAVYGVRKYIANAKTAEAKNSLGQMGKDAVTAFEGEHMKATILAPGAGVAVTRKVCPSAANTIPQAGLANVKGAKWQSTKLEWSPLIDVQTNSGFPCMKFEMTAPQYYVYNYLSDSVKGDDTSQGTNFSATAEGDLNGDTNASTFTMNGQVNADGRLLVSPSIGEVSPEE
jgi:type IV pilus assembly protein PilA